MQGNRAEVNGLPRFFDGNENFTPGGEFALVSVSLNLDHYQVGLPYHAGGIIEILIYSRHRDVGYFGHTTFPRQLELGLLDILMARQPVLLRSRLTTETFLRTLGLEEPDTYFARLSREHNFYTLSCNLIEDIDFYLDLFTFELYPAGLD